MSWIHFWVKYNIFITAQGDVLVSGYYIVSAFGMHGLKRWIGVSIKTIIQLSYTSEIRKSVVQICLGSFFFVDLMACLMDFFIWVFSTPPYVAFLKEWKKWGRCRNVTCWG